MYDCNRGEPYRSLIIEGVNTFKCAYFVVMFVFAASTSISTSRPAGKIRTKHCQHNNDLTGFDSTSLTCFSIWNNTWAA